MQIQVRSAILVATIFLCCGMAAAELSEGRIRELVKEYTAAKNSYYAGKAADELFENASKEQLRGLMFDEDISVSVLAAWTLMRRKVDDGPKLVAASQRFVGFLEARTGVPIPIHWDYELARDFVTGSVTDFHDDANLLDLRKLYAPEAHRYWEQGEWKKRKIAGSTLVHPSRIGLQSDGDKLEITVDDRKLKIDLGYLKDAFRRDGHWIEVTLGSNRSFVAFFSDSGTDFPLYCFDSSTGKLLWQSSSWVAGHKHFFMRRSANTRIEIVPHADRVAIFASVGGIFITEGFDAHSGKPLYRFAEDCYYFHDLRLTPLED